MIHIQTHCGAAEDAGPCGCTYAGMFWNVLRGGDSLSGLSHPKVLTHVGQILSQ